MEIVKKRYESLLQALASLQESLEIFGNYSDLNNSKFHAMFRDSCIQRFEYSFDAFWKFIKLYLEECENIELENNSPRYLFKIAENTEILLKNEDMDILIQALSDRNLTSHSYNVETAEEIVSHIPLYYQTMFLIATELKLKIK
ncbi:MAG: nucleotidyltransferase substrate binding protein [Candidatus Dependentiae bacterium]|nr:nucleotidyltransferase substrate binding protein [Candidatus Dependentiae bacterium]